MRLFGTAALVLLTLLPQVDAQPGAEPIVRVQVLDRIDLGRPTLEAVGSDGTILVDGVPVRPAIQGERIEIRRDGRDVRLVVAGEEHEGREITFEATEIRVRSGRTDRRYPARLAIRIEDGAVRLVNHAPMETYVASVVASELNFPEPICVMPRVLSGLGSVESAMKLSMGTLISRAAADAGPLTEKVTLPLSPIRPTS